MSSPQVRHTKSIGSRIAGMTVAALTAALLTVPAVGTAAEAATQPVTLAITSIQHDTPTIAGSVLIVSGRASKNLVGGKVALQRLDEKTWHSTGRTTKVPAARTFSMKVPAAGLGAVKYRLVSAKTVDLASGTSPSKSVATSQWFYLDALRTATQSRNWSKDDDVQVATVLRKKNVASLWSYGSFGGWKDGFAEYNLSSRCSTFDTTGGVNDTAGSKSQWNYTTVVDGAEHDWGFAALNRPLRISMDVTGAFRIRLENTRVDGTPYQDFKADAVWGDARVLCTSAP